MSRISVVLGDIAVARHAVVVNAANSSLVGSVNPHYWRFKNRLNVDTAIHRAAGPQLRKECEALPELERYVRCPAGERSITVSSRVRERNFRKLTLRSRIQRMSFP